MEIEKTLEQRKKFCKKSERCISMMLDSIKEVTKVSDEEAVSFLQMRLENLMFIAYCMSEPNASTGSMGTVKETLNFLTGLSDRPSQASMWILADLAALIDLKKVTETDLSDSVDSKSIISIIKNANIGIELEDRFDKAYKKLIGQFEKKPSFIVTH